jgi:hypothetical protein
MTVEELLDRISSPELAEWMAYQKLNGPIDSTYSDDALAQIHEVLQYLLRLTGAQYEDNPAPNPRHFPRSYEFYDPIVRAKLKAAHDEEEQIMSREEVDRIHFGA